MALSKTSHTVSGETGPTSALPNLTHDHGSI